ncbi:SDR family NAD(P)-dependent oxidoreductase [Croceicoccus sp. YJ47]|uniref:SDR family NAD(P)-dependent oxidoreductase n=1 Tax=Croceicoccus sp. YJ47 TaxID=2798724 RepID=UPI001921C305|nr:SDR family NAD(P)-dependent oxidoreductase [Croceicoccus sp. YJ47]QQN73421.1 SDR family NAD(P)-dependent oxidoreductase [Croceicoccus sp. YJ47]
MANVYIAGCSRGIGLELVRRHAERGDTVFAMNRNIGTQDALAALADAHDNVSLHELDAGDLDRIDGAVAATGDGSVDLLYIVAGVTGPLNAELATPIDWDGWDSAIDIMVKGPLAIFKAFLPRMHEGTKVVPFSSQLAASTWPMGGMYAYVACKSALNGVMRGVAKDVKDKGIIIALLHPGWVQTDMGGEQAEITVEESASGIVALADGLSMEDSGEFFKWNGEKHAW